MAWCRQSILPEPLISGIDRLKSLPFSCLAAITAALMLAGCGSSVSTPTNFTPVLKAVTPGDTQVTLTWDNTPGMSYWVWWLQSTLPVSIGATGNSVGANVMALSPYVIASLNNGLPYSFAINAHAGGTNSPGGPQSNPLLATPRLAGSTWVPCTSSGSACPSAAPTLYGITYGANAGFYANDNGAVRNYLAVGTGGTMFISPDGQNWNALPQQSACTPSGGGALRAAGFAWGTYIAAGDNGTLCYSGLTPSNPYAIALDFTTAPLTANWYTATTIPPGIGSPNFYAIGNNQYSPIVTTNWASAAGSQVVVGSNGTILWSGDGQNWYLPVGDSLPARDLYGLSYNFCGIPTWSWVVVGANGTIAATTDPTGSSAWTTAGIKVPSTVTQSLRGIACTSNSTPATLPYSQGLFTVIPLWVAAGDQGVLLTSIDGVNWSTPSNFKIDGVAVTAFPTSIRRVIFGTQFVALGDSGAVYTSVDGANWISQNSNAGGNTLYDVAQPMSTTMPNGFLGYVPFRYVAVGAGGMTTYAQ